MARPGVHRQGARVTCPTVVRREQLGDCSRNHGGASCGTVVMGTRGRGGRVACVKKETGFCPISLQDFPVDVSYTFI